MGHCRRSAVFAGIVGAVACGGLADVAPAQSVLDRPPNLSGGWLGSRGTLQFNFVHRFGVSDAPLRKVTNSPTFLLSYPLGSSFSLGTTYATSSDVAPAFPNEWEGFARVAAGLGPVDLRGQLGYNQAAQSVDGEITAAVEGGRVRLLAVGRVLSNGYHADAARYAVGGGAVLRLSRWIAIAGDVATLFDREDSEEMAWGAALQLAIPYSPHTLSLQVTNTNTATLQGLSRGIDQVRGGFEFTIPITLSRYAARQRPAPDAGGERPASVSVSIQQMAFPARIQTDAGATIAWTNNDAVVHTVTADDGSWDSGPIAPGATWRRTFATTGDYSYHCTPHPFMKAVVVVRQP